MKVQLAAWALRGVRAAERVRWPHIEVRDVVVVLLLAATLLFVAHEVNANSAYRCTSLKEVVSIPVPHPVVGNPSREWESRYEAIEFARGRHLGCRMVRPRPSEVASTSR